MTTVTINNNEQRQVEQRMLVNQLVDNGLLGSARKIGARFMAGAKGMKASAGVGKKALASKSYGAGRSVRKAGMMGKRMGQQANRSVGAFTSKHPTATAAIAGGGAATAGLAYGTRRKSKK